VVKGFLIFLVGLLAGASSILLYERYSFQHMEFAYAARTDDPNYLRAKRAMEQENPDFVKIFRGKISALQISGVKADCYLFYKKSGMIYEDNDIMYCLDKKSGSLLGRQ
jgi:hypothetical protein